MSKTVVQINFTYQMAKAEYEAMIEQAAPAIAQVEGLAWKIFIIDEEAQEAGGLYLFESIDAAEAYVHGPIIGQLGQHPGISNISVKFFNSLESATRMTRGPIDVPVLAQG
jgi:hypothetical protein